MQENQFVLDRAEEYLNTQEINKTSNFIDYLYFCLCLTGKKPENFQLQ